MALQFDQQLATLSGTVSVEEAETLATWLKEQMVATNPLGVAMADCEHVHAAVLQTLLALKPRLHSEPKAPLLRQVLSHHLDTATD